MNDADEAWTGADSPLHAWIQGALDPGTRPSTLVTAVHAHVREVATEPARAAVDDWHRLVAHASAHRIPWRLVLALVQRLLALPGDAGVGQGVTGPGTGEGGDAGGPALPQCVPVRALNVVCQWVPQVVWLWLLTVGNPCCGERGRTLVAVAGPPASGKSTTCVLWAWLMAQWMAVWAAEPGGGGTEARVQAATLGMDAYHLTNAELDERGLRCWKGRVDTFDVDAFVRDVELLRCQDTLSLPVYDRELHEPVANALRISSKHNDKWSRIGDMCHHKVYIRASMEQCLQRMIQRRRRVYGDNEAQLAITREHWQRVDEPNAKRVQATADAADTHVLPMSLTV